MKIPGLFGAEKIERLEAKRNVPGLIKRLEKKNDPDLEAPARAAEALGRIGDARAVEALLKAASDGDFRLQEKAKQSLEKIGAPAVEALIRALGDIVLQPRAAEVLGRIGAPAVKSLMAALEDGDEQVRLHAADLLGSLGDARAVDALIRALGGADKRLGVNAGYALCQIGAPAVEALIEALETGNAQMRQNAAETLGKIGDRRAVEPLLPALEDADAEVRNQAAGALCMLRDARAVEALIGLLRSRIIKEDLHEFVAETLGQIGDRRAVAPLIRELGNGFMDGLVSAAAATALGRIGDVRAIEPLVGTLASVYSYKNAIEALCVIGEPAVEALIDALQDANELVRRRAAGTLGRIGGTRAVEALKAWKENRES
jgi:HEAT repeat protein